MEFVTKNLAAIKISDELITLLDWTNIEKVSGFTLIIENAGGGSGDAISDVQIDISNDGGITSSVDQYSTLFAAAIASNGLKKEVFTTSAKYIRVRAICAEGDDTTANAWLMADYAVGRICTLADVKDRLGITTVEDDAVISQITSSMEDVFNNATNRKLILNSVDDILNWTGGGHRIVIPRYPVVSITSIKEASDYDFDNADALVANTDYRLMKDSGIIYRMNNRWLDAEDGIEIKYRGGYVSAGQVPAAGEKAMPADLREAAIMQTSFIYKRRNDIGVTSNSAMGSSITTFSAMDLLPMVKDILKKYERLIL
jgi:uncharacterized phiE125 gp8 family phage protein